MKHKLIALSCLTALLLAGCGVDEPGEQVIVPEPVEVHTTEEITEVQTEAPTTETTKATTKKTKPAKTTANTTTSTTSAETSTSAAGKATFTDRLDSYADFYKKVVQETWDDIYERNDGAVSIAYALYDIDNDQIPELLFKHGTCEADFILDIYTVDLDARLKFVDSLSGGHTSFAYDEKTNELVLVWGHMGAMSLDWYTMTDDFKLKQTNTYSHELGNDEDYYNIMFDRDVWEMDYITAYSWDKASEPKSCIYYAYSEYEEIDGLYLDFTYNGGAFR